MPATRRPPRRRRWRSAVLALVVVGAAGCSPDASPPERSTGRPVDPSGRRLTDAQAAAVAQALYRNGQVGGARLRVDAPFGTVTFHLDAEVDWVGRLGRATLTQDGGPAAARGRSEVLWGPSRVLDSGVSGLEPAMARAGRPGVVWLDRPLDPKAATLDRVLAFTAQLASDRRDNPELLRQRRDARWLGPATVGGQRTDHYRFGDALEWWIVRSDQRLVQVRATFGSASQGTVVRIVELARPTITPPPAAATVRAEDIPELYEQLTGRPAPTDPPAGDGG